MSVSVSVSVSSRQDKGTSLKGDMRAVPIRMSVEIASISVASHDALLGVESAVFNTDNNGDEGGG